MTTLVHVLCSNFTEIGRREVRECIVSVTRIKSTQNVFFWQILQPFGGGCQKYAGECATWANVSPENFVPIGSGLLQIFPKK